jgi:hypothetical protein
MTAKLWNKAKQRFHVGHRVRGIVTQHCPLNMFCDLGDPLARCLTQIVDFLERGRMTADQYPPVGEAVEDVVFGH